MIKVLVVEDEPLLMLLAIELVEDAGFEAIEARNADEAILLLEEQPDIRILLTDIDMPGSMDGLRLARAVRDRWPPVDIIIVSGKRKPSGAEMPVRSAFFEKPYDPAKLTKTMTEFANLS